MADRRQLIGNEIRSGGQKLSPRMERANRIVSENLQNVRTQRQQIIDFAASPPPLPVPPRLADSLPNNPSFNQVAYSVLLIGVLTIVAVGTNDTNWAFLIYAALAVIARIPSTQMFIAALMSLILIPVTTALQRDTLASSFAVMTFYFMVIGLLRAALELRRAKRDARKLLLAQNRKRSVKNLI